MKQLLSNCRVFDGERVHKHRSVVLHGRHIAEIATAGTPCPDADREIDLGGNLLAPGLIDLQVNGGGGVLFNDAPEPDTIRTIVAAHRRTGTTGLLPTLISDETTVTDAAVAAVESAIAEDMAGVLGLHLEGPHLNPGRHGIHDETRFRPLDDDAFRTLEGARVGRLLCTVAPETLRDGQIRRLTDKGILVFGGHSMATYEQTLKALDEGLCGFTHLFNAMTPLTSREPGMVGAALDNADSVMTIIADGIHVHPATLRLAIRSKPDGKAILITDAMPCVGSTLKSFTLFGRQIHVRKGSCVDEHGTLAGANIGMIDAVRYVSRSGGVDQYEALRMASAYPARLLGLHDQLGAIRPGYRASLIELDDDLRVVRNWIDGDMLAC